MPAAHHVCGAVELIPAVYPVGGKVEAESVCTYSGGVLSLCWLVVRVWEIGTAGMMDFLRVEAVSKNRLCAEEAKMYQ